MCPVEINIREINNLSGRTVRETTGQADDGQWLEMKHDGLGSFSARTQVVEKHGLFGNKTVIKLDTKFPQIEPGKGDLEGKLGEKIIFRKTYKGPANETTAEAKYIPVITKNTSN